MRVRIIPGAATQTDFRALVLTDSTTAPTVGARRERDEQWVGGSLKSLYSTATRAMKDQLDLHRVYPYRFRVSGLASGEHYRVEAGGHRAVKFRTAPARIDEGGITVALASCYYDGFSRGPAYRRALERPCRFTAPLFKVLAGDNVYVDIGAVDGQDLGYEYTVYRYVRYFWHSGYADALETVPTLTTYDDHEYWNNYPESQVWLERSWLTGGYRREFIEAGDECLDIFQGSLNPPPVAGNGKGRSFVYAVPPLTFFFVDVRTNRELYDDLERAQYGPGGPRSMIPEADLGQFERWCRNLGGPGVLVIGQPLWMEAGGKTDYNPPDFPSQYRRLWDAIARAPHDVLILSGDVHFSRALEIELGDRTVGEFVSSPASHIPVNTATALGTYWPQGNGTVSYPRKLPLGQMVLPQPRLGRYLMGTDVPNTIALLHFLPVANGKVVVGAAMVDLETNGIAPSREVDRPGWFTGRDKPVFPCFTQSLFTLR